MIYIIDCGTSQLENIIKIVNEFGYSCKAIKIEEVKKSDLESPEKIIITGGPVLLTQVDPQKYLDSLSFIKSINVPVLGICLGHQMIGLLYGSKISVGEDIEMKEKINIKKQDNLLKGIKDGSLFQEQHSEHITLPEEFTLLVKSESCENEVMKHKVKKLYGTQFHPEMSGEVGKKLLKSFLNI